MPKNIRVEGFKYQFMATATQLDNSFSEKVNATWYELLDKLVFEHNKKTIYIVWDKRQKSMTIEINDLKLYQRGDTFKGVKEQEIFQEDSVVDEFKKYNQELVSAAVEKLFYKAGFIARKKDV